MNKIILQLEGGKEVDLAEVIASQSIEQLKEMGFPINENGKIDMKSFAPAMAKTEAEEKAEGISEAANFIKSLVIPAKDHKRFDVKEIEYRQINTGSGSFGAAVPVTLANAILERKARFNVIRNRAFAFELAGTYDLPIEGTGVTGFWITGEVDAGNVNLITESHPTLLKRTLQDHYLGALVKISWKLMQTTDINIVNFVSSLAGKALAEREEAAFIGGTGTAQPAGLRQAITANIAQAASALTYADLVRLYFHLPAQYRQNAVFITSAAGARLLNGLADNQGRPIFAPGAPLDELFRRPLIESADIPANLGAGTNETEIIFGDPYYYWIKDGQGLSMATQDVIERLQTKLVVYQAVDGALTLPEAFVRLTAVR